MIEPKWDAASEVAGVPEAEQEGLRIACRPLPVSLREPRQTRSTCAMEEAVRVPVSDFTLDGRIAVPAGATAGAVICHPHPQYGGSMENALVIALAETLSAAGFATLRFDFRGVGASGGRYDDGRGEVDDVAAAAATLRARLDTSRVALVGYSFGSMMALRAGAAEPDRTTGVVAIAPPVRMIGLDFLAGCPVPLAFLIGDRDQFCPLATLESGRDRFAPASTLALIPGADHFFGGHLEALAARVVELVQDLPRRVSAAHTAANSSA